MRRSPRLELSVQYAARAAALSGHPEFVDDLLDMAEVEWDHERYFRLKSASHWAWRWMPQWEPTAPQEEIRRAFAEFRSGAESFRDKGAEELLLLRA